MIRQVATANAILLLQYAAAALVPLLLVPHIVRSIGVTGYGHLAVALAWAGFGGLLTQYAFPLTGSQRLAAGGEPAQVLAQAVATKALLLVAVLPPLALVGFLQAPAGAAGAGTWLVLLAVPAGAALNAGWFLQYHGRFLAVALASIAGTCGALLLGGWGVDGAGPGDMLAAAAALSFGGLFVGVATLLAALRLAGVRRPAAGSARVLQALREDWPLFASQLASALYALSGPIVINQLVDASAAGRYGAIERIVAALSAACLLTHVAAYPRLAQLYLNNRPGYWTLLKIVVAGYLAAAGALAACLWAFRAEVIRFVLGTDAADARALLAWGLAWLVVGIFGPALTGYLTVSGRSRQVMPLTMQVLAVCVLVGLPAVAMFGPSGWMAALVSAQGIVLLKAHRQWIHRDAP